MEDRDRKGEGAVTGGKKKGKGESWLDAQG